MTEEQVKHMVNRFLGWRLPENFQPDAGISFKAEYNVEYNAARGMPPARHLPSGTNLFDATQAEAMVATWSKDAAVSEPQAQTTDEQMVAAGFEWEPTDAGYPRWTYRSKDIFCVKGPHVTDEQWEERKQKGIVESKLDMPPSFFAQLGQPMCSRWGKSEFEWIALAYVQALANDGDRWRPLSREKTYQLLSDEQKRRNCGMLENDLYEDWFQSVSRLITDSDGAFSVGGFWHRGRAHG